MPTLRSPDGREYETTDPVELRNLVLGHGYTIVDSRASTEDTENSEPEQETTPTDG